MKFKHVPNILIDSEGSKWKLTMFEPSNEYSMLYVREGAWAGMWLTPSQVETKFTREGRPKSKFGITTQGKYECAAASLAMLLDESLFSVKRAMGKAHWRNDNRGAKDQMIIDAARYLGADLIHLRGDEIDEDIGPASLHLPSLNMKGMGHAVTWNGKQVMDPQWGIPGKYFWGTEWAPWTMGCWGALELQSRRLTDEQRKLHDKMLRKRLPNKQAVTWSPEQLNHFGIKLIPEVNWRTSAKPA